MLQRRLGTIRQLEILRAIADEGGIGRAAAVLHLSQPAVSLQLQKLADAIGEPLHQLVGRELRLTDTGRRVVETARLILSEVARLESDLAARRGLTAGTLRLAVVNTAEYFFPELLAQFCAAHPGVDVQFAIGNRDQILERLHERRDDLYVFSAVPVEADLEVRPLLANPLVAVAPSDHPWTKRRAIPLAELAAAPLIAREPGSGTRLALEQHLQRHGLTLQPRVVMASNEAIKDAVRAGLGLAVLSAHSLRRDPAGLIRLRVRTLPIPSRWSLVYPKALKPSTLTRAFIAELESAAAALEQAEVGKRR